ncbi:hypothetical protein FF38_00230 [Lucilia cuprina]|uniref:Pupal cuticle protein n=1 Tax=Lucilia cuprina TaxID=7375 RepID=A0A0L0BVH8_LUCCU|nr:Pupal cuticle protein [Lucilia cuprina]KNC24026.1 hypothetical protein FF38_00230 [Lucilia cuprina]
MKTILCLILATSLALTSAYSARPQFNKQQSNNYNVNKKSYQQPAASTNNYHKASTVLSSTSSSSEKESQILHNDMEMKGDGTYHYDFETSNGIKRTEQGAVDGTIQGSSSYISPEGVEIKTTYVADETGYHPVGDHIPQIPDYIVRALEYIRTHPYIEKDYYTGEVKQTSFSNKKSLPIATTKRSAYSNSNNQKKASSNNSKYNFRH